MFQRLANMGRVCPNWILVYLWISGLGDEHNSWATSFRNASRKEPDTPLLDVFISQLLDESRLTNKSRASDSGIPLHCDNQGSVALAKNPENHQRTKHIDIWYHYIREKKEDGTIAIDYLPTEEMIADGLTKVLTSAKMKIFIEQLGFC